MFRILDCIRYEHDYRLVLVAVLICALTAWTAWYLYSTASQSLGLRRQAWILQTAVVAGSGIWATHFIAMLAFRSTLPITYDPLLTLWSLLIAISVTGIGFCVIGSESSKVRILAASAVIGLGIATMHYSGMNAMNVAGRIEWDPQLVGASILLGTGFALASVWSFKATQSKLLAAGFLTAAICSLHFTAMAAATVQYDPTIVIDTTPIDTTLLATAISGVTLLAILVGLTAALINVQTERENGKHIAHLKHIADHDHLTGLPNRNFIGRKIDALIDEAKGSQRSFALLFLDLDRFKGVNDNHGHDIGDYVLQQAARRLKEATSSFGVVARTGGDEFIVLVDSGASQSAVRLVSEIILSAFSQPFEIRQGGHASLGVSIGAAVYPQDGCCAETILRAADQALYRAKQTGRRAAIVAA
jgi:diguanylate cyclase (GGDEF)-like protein